jgi:hypothetical protein
MTHGTDATSRSERHRVLTRQLLAVCAWTLLLLTGVGVILTFPPIEKSILELQGTVLGDVLATSLLLVLGLSGFGVWLSAILYALTDPDHPSRRMSKILALVVTNVIGALVYYFFFVRDQKSEVA